MTEVPDQLIEVSADLYEAAACEATTHGRTVRQQLEHWVRIGRAVASAAGGENAGADAVHHPTTPPSLRPETNAELDAKIAAAVEAANFGTTLAARGLTTVALDDEGRLVEYRPDGSTTFL